MSDVITFKTRAGKIFRAIGLHGSKTIAVANVPTEEHGIEKRGGTVLSVTEPVTPGERIIAAAKSNAGQHEDPPGSNWGGMIPTFLRFVGWLRPAAWCCAFALYTLAKAGYPLGIKTASVYELEQWARAHGVWSELATVPQQGWLAVFESDVHVTIVDKDLGASIEDWGGNTSAADGLNYNGGQVAPHTHTKTLLRGYVRTY